MIRTRLRAASLVAVLSLVAACSQRAATGHETERAGGPRGAPTRSDAKVGLRLVQTIPLPGVDGRIDHLAIDLARKRLFVAALGHDTVEVVDLAAGNRVRSLSGLSEPQGVAYLEDVGRLVVASGGSGAVDFFDGATLERVSHVRLGRDADNVRYDAAAKILLVAYGEGALAALDPRTGAKLWEVNLAGHPEAFALERSSARVYVDVPDAGHVAVVDRVRHAVEATWPVKGAVANFPLALDEAGHRLFVGCRRPARLLVIDTTTGALITSLEVGGDPDDVFYDGVGRRLFVACGEGRVDVVDQRGPDSYAIAAQVATAPGARTCLFVPELGRLLVAVPHRGEQPAEIRVFDVTSEPVT
jgi:DNA-binding beta-propeller fold protein YncE